MNGWKQYWWLLLTFAIVTIVFLLEYKNLKPLEWKTIETVTTISAVFVKLLIIGALLDQLIEVFFPQGEDITSRVKSMEVLSFIKAKRKTLERELLNQQLYGLTDNTDILERIDEQVKSSDEIEKKAKENINKIDSKRSASVRKIAFAIGLVLALSGINILGDFIDMSNKNLNNKVLSYFDILFTAAVLSGGTSGINQLLRVIKDSTLKN